jgi:hypothetical protein
MSEPIGRTVLRHVAAHYRAHPTSWCTGPGNLEYVVRIGDPVSAAKALCDPTKPGCIDTQIRCQSLILAGVQGQYMAHAQAVKILWEHHKLPHELESIWGFNDKECISAQHAAAFIEAALGTSTAQAPPLPAKTIEPAKKQVCGALAVAIIGFFVVAAIFGNAAA